MKRQRAGSYNKLKATYRLTAFSEYVWNYLPELINKPAGKKIYEKWLK